MGRTEFPIEPSSYSTLWAATTNRGLGWDSYPHGVAGAETGPSFRKGPPFESFVRSVDQGSVSLSFQKRLIYDASSHRSPDMTNLETTPELNDFSDYRDYLRAVLVDRQARNPRYSFRAFARSLGLNHGYLHAILKRTRTPSIETLEGIASHLLLTPHETEVFILTAATESIQSAVVKNVLEKRIAELKTPVIMSA